MKILFVLFLCLSAHAESPPLKGWPSGALTYCTEGMPKKFEKTVDACFEKWAKVAALSFKRVKSDANIVLKWETDENVFRASMVEASTSVTHYGDGTITASTTIFNAHGFNWRKDKPYFPTYRFPEKSSISFECVCGHEIGHALGLMDADDENAVMHGADRGNHELNEDDVKKIQKLYPVARDRKWATKKN